MPNEQTITYQIYSTPPTAPSLGATPPQTSVFFESGTTRRHQRKPVKD